MEDLNEKTMLVLKNEKFALNVAKILFCFVLRFVETTFLLVESERMCIIIFVWFFFLIKN
jgi:hypothetical protein